MRKGYARHVILALGFCLLGACACLLPRFLSADDDPAERFKKVVNPMVEAIHKANYEAAQKDFGKVMLDAFPLDKMKTFFNGLEDRCGKVTKLDEPRLAVPDKAAFPAHFEKGMVLDIVVVLDGADKIVGLWFLPHAPDIPVPEKHETKLRFPVAGRCFVGWGGDTRELNEHHDVPNQRFAFDFIGVGPDGKTYKGEGKTNEDFYIFGREILAPGDGVVTDVIEGVRDNVPGSMNPYSALGNAVFIRHKEHEVSILAHLKLGSVKVKASDHVKAGQVIGLCGNSGNSSEAHLHYHLQNTDVIQDGAGIKVFFEKIVLVQDEKETVKENYSPVKGEVVCGQ